MSNLFNRIISSNSSSGGDTVNFVDNGNGSFTITINGTATTYTDREVVLFTGSLPTVDNYSKCAFETDTKKLYFNVGGTFTEIGKTTVGLGNVDNTADLDKPISTATQTALGTKAPIDSPTFTGTPKLKTGATVGQLWTATSVDGEGNWADAPTSEGIPYTTVTTLPTIGNGATFDISTAEPIVTTGDGVNIGASTLNVIGQMFFITLEMSYWQEDNAVELDLTKYITDNINANARIMEFTAFFNENSAGTWIENRGTNSERFLSDSKAISIDRLDSISGNSPVRAVITGLTF